MDNDRAVQILLTNGWIRSGYAITSNCILTAGHVVDHGRTAPNRFDFRLWGDLRNGEQTWKSAYVLWSHPTLDVALLRVRDEEIVHSTTLKTLSAQRNQAAMLARLPSSGQYDTEAFGWSCATRHRSVER